MLNNLMETSVKKPLTPTPIKLKPRLRKLFQLIDKYRDTYDEVWDCCCDHGYLGMKLLRKGVCKRVNFVDCVEHLTTDLSERLAGFPAKKFSVQCLDAGKIQLTSQQRHLVVLAGIGGELATTIIDTIIQNHPAYRIDFLLCPNTAQYHLREYLMAKNFSLLEEDFLREKRWNYEIILTRYNDTESQTPVTSIGEHWQENNPDHIAYLKKMHGHYSDQVKSCQTGRATKIANAYQDRLQILTADH